MPEQCYTLLPQLMQDQNSLHQKKYKQKIQIPRTLSVVLKGESILKKWGVYEPKMNIQMFQKKALYRLSKQGINLQDFGEEHEIAKFLRNAEANLKDFLSHPNSHMIGAMIVTDAFTNILMERLRIVDDLQKFPAIRNIPVQTPIFIVGLPRTGSTLLHSLLAQDPNLRAPLLWEMEHPSLPRSQPDPRLKLLQERIEWATAKMPYMLNAHFVDASSPDECIMLFKHAFVDVVDYETNPSPTSSNFIINGDWTYVYEYHKLLLQILTYRKTVEETKIEGETPKEVKRISKRLDRKSKEIDQNSVEKDRNSKRLFQISDIRKSGRIDLRKSREIRKSQDVDFRQSKEIPKSLAVESQSSGADMQESEKGEQKKVVVVDAQGKVRVEREGGEKRIEKEEKKRKKKGARRWVLKSPYHGFHIDDLARVYPDALFIHTHRDPCVVIPSMTSLMSNVGTLRYNPVDTQFVGQRQISLFSKATDRLMRFRETNPNSNFCDVAYRDLVANPIQAVKTIYAHHNLPFSPEFEQKMNSWLQENPQNKHGKHRYSLEQFGLDKDEIDASFCKYTAKFAQFL
eukprot:Phypoly_transcript_06159.p1 GENE.Phypoly_transcript_06159~~Phypoly_transcript_06159.p1  ORF type:complete len:571 (+),score=88.59 Phypoly_transcript_06159:92-1804(+)